MLTSLKVRNFKCFEAEGFSIAPLTLMSGLNSTGKSTVLQALLLLRQSYLSNLLPTVGLSLNGDFVQLGTAKDVLFEDATEEFIDFEVAFSDGANGNFHFGYDQSANVLDLLGKPVVQGNIFDSSLFGDMCHYLEAERIGPRSSFEMSDFNVHRHRQLGVGGEFAAHFLAQFGSKITVADPLHHPSTKSTLLADQAEAWMNEVSPGLRLHYTPHPAMDLVNLRISFSFSRSVASNEYRPTNVGFGVTYIFPIIVALLGAAPGALVLIENPEAHLHPRAQVKIGELIARAVASGVQVIFETHSDHVLNGVRLAVRKRFLSAEQAGVYFFQKSTTEKVKSSTVTKLSLDKDGRIDNWPDGFFDEFERVLEQLL
jgi:predicted ATPase